MTAVFRGAFLGALLILLIGQIVLLGADDAAEDGRLGAVGDALYRRHNLILALINVMFPVILAETSRPANVGA
jgi:hypothetical protein